MLTALIALAVLPADRAGAAQKPPAPAVALKPQGRDLGRVARIGDRLMRAIEAAGQKKAVKIYLEVPSTDAVEALAYRCDSPSCGGGRGLRALNASSAGPPYAGAYVVAISRGAVEYARNDDELATLVAQSIGQVYMGGADGATERARSQDTNFAIGCRSAACVRTQVAPILIYSEPEETKADLFGLKYAYAAGYSPVKGIEVWERMDSAAALPTLTWIKEMHVFTMERMQGLRSNASQLEAAGQK